MTDDQVAVVRDAIRAYRAEQRVFHPGAPDHFADLTYQLASHPVLFPENLDPYELHAVAAMLVLGSPWGRLPNAAARAHLIEVVSAFEPVASICMADMLHLVLKYGCGVGRHLVGVDRSWHGQWPGSMTALSAMILPFVDQSNNCLELQVVAFPQKFDPRTREILAPEHMADKLAHVLTHPETPLHLGQNEMLTITCEPKVTKIVLPGPDDCAEVFAGGKYVFTVGCDVTLRGPDKTYRVPAGSKIVVSASDESARVELRTSESPRVQYLGIVELELKESAVLEGPAPISVWECTCGNAQCAHRHRLSAWNHREWPLISFVATAVKGPGAEGRTVNNLYVKSFVTSMYFAWLARRGV